MNQPPQRSPYEIIGGQAAIDRLVERFYQRMDTLPEAKVIRALHAADLGPMIIVLKKYLGEWLGGPKLYSAERGHPMLRARHLPFTIGVAERDAWLLCMNGALDETITDATARAGIRDSMTRLADWMRNKSGEPPPTG
jgi:hemoglobin